MVLISVCPVLKSLPQMGASFSRESSCSARNVDREVGSAVGEGHAFLQRGVGVDHGGRDHLIIARKPFSKASSDWCTLPGLIKVSVEPHQIMTSRSAPLDALELADIVAQLLGQVPLVLALLHVRAVQVLHVILVEDRLARLDGRQERLHLVEQRMVEHAGIARRRVHVVVEDVPAGEDQVAQVGQRHKVLDLGRAALGALAQADGAHLRQRPDGLAMPLRTASTPATKVVATAPMPGIMTPEFAFGRRDVRSARFPASTACLF